MEVLPSQDRFSPGFLLVAGPPPALAGFGRSNVNSKVWPIAHSCGLDGDFDWGYIAANQPFVATDHCGMLYVVGEGILPRYLYHELRVTKDAYSFDRTYRPKLDNLRTLVTARIPVNPYSPFGSNK